MLEITPELLLQAYRIGVFPMGERRDDPKLYWLDPRLRAVLPLDGFHLPQRLKRTDPHRPLRGHAPTPPSPTPCAPAPSRGRAIPRAGSTSRSSTLYGELHRRGHAHSVECRVDGPSWSAASTACRSAPRSSARACSAASATPRKVALVHLVARLIKGGFRLLDCQFMTEHLQQLRRHRDPARGVPRPAGRRASTARRAFSASWAARMPAPSCRTRPARRRRRGRAPTSDGVEANIQPANSFSAAWPGLLSTMVR